MHTITVAPMCNSATTCSSSSHLFSAGPREEWTVRPVTPETVDEVVTFINKARQDMFPTLHKQLAVDVTRWVRSGYFLVARDEKDKRDGFDGRIVGTIGFVPYDHRFPKLDYRDVAAAEVVRLYVIPERRRGGLGTALFKALKQEALKGGLDLLYLHTHPFLPGAVRFWEDKGFETLFVEEDPVWKTTHMQMMLRS